MMKMFGGTIKLTPFGMAAILLITGFLLILYLRSENSSQEKNDAFALEVNLKKLLALSIYLAQKGGEEVKNVHSSANLNEQSKGKTKEGANDPLTDADLRSHRMIVYGFKKYYPNIKVVSEEHSSNFATFPDILPNMDFKGAKNLPDENVPVEDIIIWIDPLDATQEFTENLLKYVTTMICITVKGKPIIGIIHQPFKEKTAWGWVNKDFILEDLKKTESRTDSVQKKIIVSRSHAGKVKEVALKAFGNDTEVIPAGGAGYKTLQVIEGNADAYIHITLIKKWDICAGDALIKSAGGKMTTLQGVNVEYSSKNVTNDNGLVAALHNHEEYLKLLSNIHN